MYRLFLAIPEQVILDDDVESLIAPGSEGYLEVLTNHAPLLTTLQEGKITVTDKDKKKRLWWVSGGVLEVFHNKVTLLADTVEPYTEHPHKHYGLL